MFNPFKNSLSYSFKMFLYIACVPIRIFDPPTNPIKPGGFFLKKNNHSKKTNKTQTQMGFIKSNQKFHIFKNPLSFLSWYLSMCVYIILPTQYSALYLINIYQLQKYLYNIKLQPEEKSLCFQLPSVFLIQSAIIYFELNHIRKKTEKVSKNNWFAAASHFCIS